MATSKKKKKGLKTAPFDTYINIACTGEKFLLKNVHAEMKIRELKCYAELVVGIPYNLQRLQYLDEGDMLDDSDLRHNDVVAGATINLKLWRSWDNLVAAVCRGTIDQVLKEGVALEKAWESLAPTIYRNKVSIAKDRASVALFIAAHRGRINLIRSLIGSTEADVNMKTPFGRTPLHAASSQGHSNTIDLMLEKGASMDEIDVQGKSALMVASQCGFKDSERHLFLFQWQTRAAKTKPKRRSKSLMMHQQFDSTYPTWLKGKYAQVYFCQTLPPGEFAGTGISAPRRRPVDPANQLQYEESFLEQSSDELPPISAAVDYDGKFFSRCVRESRFWEMFACQVWYQGQIQEFLIGGGGGGPNYGSEGIVERFCGKLLLPHTPSHQSRLYVIIPWPLALYLNSTVIKDPVNVRISVSNKCQV